LISCALREKKLRYIPFLLNKILINTNLKVKVTLTGHDTTLRSKKSEQLQDFRSFLFRIKDLQDNRRAYLKLFRHATLIMIKEEKV